MSALHDHVADQQVAAMNMQNVLEVIELLDRNKLAPDAVTKLIAVALDLATRLNSGLDSVNLPET